MDKETEQMSINTFLALVRAGLWADIESSNIRHQGFKEPVDWDNVYRLSEEQSVIGVVLAGIERSSIKPPRELLLQWIGEVQMLEQQNKAMNKFIAELIEKMRKVGIYTLLVKGQGVAQCYERPLWRTSGDVDLFLNKENYDKAKTYLRPLATSTETEYQYECHLGMTIDSWTVELHGTLRSGLSSKVDKVLDGIWYDMFCGGHVRSWVNNRTQVFLPGINADVTYVFTHILQHLYRGGVGLRQICDWCRLLWKHYSDLDLLLLEKRILQMGLMSEWKAFGAFAVEYLGMPAARMPFYASNRRWKRKAARISIFILSVGNFGHKRDSSYLTKYPYLIRKCISFGRRIGDLYNHAKIFPLDSFRFLPRIVINGIQSTVRGE